MEENRHKLNSTKLTTILSAKNHHFKAKQSVSHWLLLVGATVIVWQCMFQKWQRMHCREASWQNTTKANKRVVKPSAVWSYYWVPVGMVENNFKIIWTVHLSSQVYLLTIGLTNWLLIWAPWTISNCKIDIYWNIHPLQQQQQLTVGNIPGQSC